MTGVRVMLAARSAFLRARHRKIVDGDAEMVVVAEVEDAMTSLPLVRSLSPDVVLMEDSLPPIDGHSVARAVMGACPDAKVIVLSSHPEPRAPSLAGAARYLSETCSAEDLLAAIRLVTRESSTSHPTPSREMRATELHPVELFRPERKLAGRSQSWMVGGRKPGYRPPQAEDRGPLGPTWKVVASILNQVRQQPESDPGRSRPRPISAGQLVRI